MLEHNSPRPSGGGIWKGAEGGREMGGERGECVSAGERGCEKKSRRKKSNVKDPT